MRPKINEGPRFMPKLNRRNFLQFASAAGLAPALPGLAATAAPAAAAPAGASSAQMLWASIYARAGTAAGFGQVAGSMGLPPAAAAGVAGQVVQHQALTASVASRVLQTPRPGAISPLTSGGPDGPNRLGAQLRRWVLDDAPGQRAPDPDAAPDEAEASSAEATSAEPSSQA